MNRVDFVDQLPLSVHCDHCVADIRATGWQVAAYRAGQWIGINVAECQACGSVHIGAAGSSREALAEAHKLRRVLLERTNIV
jgi:hypothetical protein